MTEARLDKWLFCARLCRTRTAAQMAIEAGKVRRNGVRVTKPGQAIHAGDALTLTLGGIVRVLTVLGLTDQRGSPVSAQGLYEVVPD